MTQSGNWLKWISEIQAIAQSGLHYSENKFDIERFKQLRHIAAEMAACCSGGDSHEIEKNFALEAGYATPKIDVRAFILKDNRLLLVKERMDGRWSLPGGWVDVNLSPSEAIIKEVKEEAGYEVSVIRLLALWDKLKHEHPPEWPHAYKCFFLCEILAEHATADASPNIEIADQAFVDLNQLPELSTSRVTKNQILRLFKLATNPQPTQFD